MKEEERRYEEAARVLPGRLREQALAQPPEVRQMAEEFRLRAGQPLVVLLPEGERSLGAAVTPEDLETLCDLATDYSRYAAEETLREGYLSVRGGFRVGLCGTAVMREGEIVQLRNLFSASVRIARQVKGAADGLLPRLCQGGRLTDTLILAPPGLGKTTLLRDLIRQVSDGTDCEPLRVALADERGEVAALYQGLPQLDVGAHTDVLDGCPKAQGLMLLLRAMNPQVLAVDEITAPEDAAALEMAANCGVSLLCTAHAGSLEELKARFTKAMDNDLNTSMAVTVLYDVLKARTTDATKRAALDSFDQVLGLKLTEKAASLRKTQAAAPAAGGFTVVCEDGGQDPQVEALIRARADAKKAKNFAEADRIRDELKAQGVEITDVPGGVRWKRA